MSWRKRLLRYWLLFRYGVVVRPGWEGGPTYILQSSRMLSPNDFAKIRKVWEE